MTVPGPATSERSRPFDFETLRTLRQRHPAWVLMAADTAPFVIPFLYKTFLAQNIRQIPLSELRDRLDDALRAANDCSIKPDRTPLQLIADWERDGWIRKFNAPKLDEPACDLTTQAETAVKWARELAAPKPFIGTESKLRALAGILRAIDHSSTTDPEARLRDLRADRDRINAEIREVMAGRVADPNPVALQEQFLRLEDETRAVLADFRSLGDEFRAQAMKVSEAIATSEAPKAELLDAYFVDQKAIANSASGQSFRAFWDYLMNPDRIEEMEAQFRRALDLPAIKALNPDPRLGRFFNDLEEGARAAQAVIATLDSRLARYVEERTGADSRRLTRLFREVEALAISARDTPPPGKVFLEIRGQGVEMSFSMERPLWTAPSKTVLDLRPIAAGSVTTTPDALYPKRTINEERLRQNIREALATSSQVSLMAVLEKHPLRMGLVEVITYISLAARGQGAILHEAERDTVSWTDADGQRRTCQLPRVVFVKEGA